MSMPHSQAVKAGDFDSPIEGSNPSEAASPELYLIAHKVRGAVAFDIAIQMEMEDGVWWILPSVGHRVYPIDHISLNQIEDRDTGWLINGAYRQWIETHPNFNSAQDFWEVTTPLTAKKAEVADRQSGLNLLSQLGLVKDRPHTAVTGKLMRRI